ncbi:VOC family protein [Picrophilus oshimae]|uniref:VOC domain-containing protein n=1 Tax=Picrophilus torridus (strain ATCC 700027 / DSM 9790 / JCM 10055 / NBRC 100828 / KAW 2/3) TaxID=1122961 RepID=A0A8G2FWA0_PICTO|nr:hypothetical protein [Picrophilus oshimae]SMD30653.1 hypothetical protein SAMN02745355_0546 [Picrophilus oshimae DSM 9789]
MKSIFHTLKEITFFVDNIIDASKYYKNIFGEPIFKSDHFILYNAGFINIGFHQSDEKSLKANIVPYFSVEDIDQAIKYLLSHNFKIYREKIKGVDSAYLCQLISPFNNCYRPNPGIIILMTMAIITFSAFNVPYKRKVTNRGKPLLFFFNGKIGKAGIFLKLIYTV